MPEMSEEEALALSQTFLGFAVTHQTERIGKIVSSLREVADDIERENKIENIQRDPAAVAARVVHTLVWGMANLSLDSLITNAGQVYEASATEKDRRIDALVAAIENGDV